MPKKGKEKEKEIPQEYAQYINSGSLWVIESWVIFLTLVLSF